MKKWFVICLPFVLFESAGLADNDKNRSNTFIVPKVGSVSSFGNYFKREERPIYGLAIESKYDTPFSYLSSRLDFSLFTSSKAKISDEHGLFEQDATVSVFTPLSLSPYICSKGDLALCFGGGLTINQVTQGNQTEISFIGFQPSARLEYYFSNSFVLLDLSLNDFSGRYKGNQMRILNFSKSIGIGFSL